jgi:hypothetical protein
VMWGGVWLVLLYAQGSVMSEQKIS